MTTIHPPTPRHSGRPALISAVVLALVAMITLAVLVAASEDPTPTSGPADVDRPAPASAPATGSAGDMSTLGDWDVLCFKPAHRDAPPCLRRSTPDQVTSGRLP
jgi:invasion protein IalB